MISNENELYKQFENLHYAGNIPIRVYVSGALTLSFPEVMFAEYSASPGLNEAIFKRQASSAALYSEEAPIYFAYDICGDAIVILGPMASKKPEYHEIRDFCKKRGIESRHVPNFRVIPYKRAARILALAHFLLTEETVDFETVSEAILISNGVTETVVPLISRQTRPPEILQYQLSNSENEIQHISYQEEEQLLSAITRGDMDGLLSIFMSTATDAVGTMSASPFKNSEYGSVIGVSLFARASIAGGVDSYRAYDLNDIFLQKLSRCKTTEEHSRVIVEAAQSFIEEVKRAKVMSTKSPHIKKAKSYIARHLNTRFAVSDLADYVGVDKSYLARLFKKHENCTIAEYICRERIKAAQELLKHTDQSVNEIAAFLHFASHSYFSSMFRKVTGITPTEYRSLDIHP